MRILVAGASGFLGGQLIQELRRRGDTVVRLVRQETAAPDQYRWDPVTGNLPQPALDGVDAVVNLGGAPVARLWTGRGRRLIRDSRIVPTSVLAQGLAELATRGPDRPVLVSASAVGYYGETGDQPVTEDSPSGRDFLAAVCRGWEAATRPASDAGCRVVRLRIGPVLQSGGGLLGPMVPLFRLGLGGRFGSGQQYLSWISMVDWLRAVTWIIDHPQLSGPVNLVGPAPASNAELVHALGRLLGRPTALTVPAPLLRLALGGFATELLGSRRVLPEKLVAGGFEFQYPDLESALRAAILES